MASFTDVFGGQTVPPSEPSLTRIDLAADGALAWPDNFSGTVVDEYLASSIVEVSLSSPLVLSLPPADHASVGTDILVRNVGSAQLSIIDAEGGAVTVVDPGESKYFYVQVNLTAAGIWQVFTYGTGTSGADASLLAGMGLQADTGNKLQLYVEYRSVNSDTDIVVEDRAKIVEIVAGSVTVTLPQVSEAGNGFSVMLRNSSDGSVVIEGFGSEQVDGTLNKTLFPGESCVLVCNGTYWISVGYGRDAEFMFSEVVVDASLGNITLTSSEVAGRMIRVAGVATGNVTITLPTVDNIYFVSVESGVGGFQVELKTSLPGSSVSLAANQSTILYCDGSNVGIAINTALVSTLNLADGSAAIPSIRYSLDSDTGLFRSASGQISFSSNGVATAGFNGSGLFSTTAATADSTTKAATTAFVQNNFTGRSITAGDGLTGGGTLATSRTLTLGTPTTLTTGTANAVTATSHTHAVTFPVTSVAGKTGAVTLAKADVGLSNVTNDAQLKIASNLSDLNNAATARTNLGLGTAALKNTGTSGDAVPLLNAANTFSASQAISVGSGYASWYVRRLDQKGPGIESQAGLDISTGIGDARILSIDTTNNILRYLRVKNAGGATVTDSTGAEREILRSDDVTTNPADTTAERLLKVGDFGVGAPALTLTANTGDWNTATIGGAHYMGFNCVNAPLPNMWFIGATHHHNSSYQVQEVSTFTTSYPRKFVRGNVSGVWTSWAEVFTQKSILGTVSQSGGVPTGAIIERVSNANGVYIRFADGTQICMVQFSGTSAVTTASGSSFVSAELGWNLPAAFANDYIAASGCVLGTGACTVMVTNITTTLLNWRLHSSVSGTFNNPRVMAIGRWF